MKDDQFLIKQKYKKDYEDLMKFFELEENLNLEEDGKLTVNEKINLNTRKLSDISYFTTFLPYFVNVKRLILQKNNIRSIDDLKGLVSIEYLDVSWNMIEFVEINTNKNQLIFQQLGYFDCICQKDGQISTMKGFSVSQLPNLQKLYASFNSRVSEFSLQELPKLQTLFIFSFMRVSSVENERNGSNLKSVQRKKHDSFIQSFKKLNSSVIKRLDLSQNDLQSISFFHNPNIDLSCVKKLDLFDNRIKQLPQLQMTALQHLDLNRNRLKSMKQVRKLKCANLRQLLLDENQLRELSLFGPRFEGLQLFKFSIEGTLTGIVKWTQEIFIHWRLHNPLILEKLVDLNVCFSEKEIIKIRGNQKKKLIKNILLFCQKRLAIYIE